MLFRSGIITCENQKKIPKLKKLKSIYKEKFGQLENIEIKNAEIIFIKLLDYNINFMTAYDYLCYLFQNKQEFIELPRNNLEIIIKENILEYCCKNPITLVQDCIEKVEKSKALRCPVIIKRKLINSQQQRKNPLNFDIPNNNNNNRNNINNSNNANINRSPNKDESLSTSLSSGYYNNNHSNDGNNANIKNYNTHNNSNNNTGQKTPLKNVICKNINIYIEKSPEEKNINNNFNNNDRYTLARVNNSITINADYDENFAYNKKLPQNLKNFTQKKEKKMYSKILMLKTNKSIREKKMLRNNNSNIRLRLNYTNNLPKEQIDFYNNFEYEIKDGKGYIKEYFDNKYDNKENLDNFANKFNRQPHTAPPNRSSASPQQPFADWQYTHFHSVRSRYNNPGPPQGTCNLPVLSPYRRTDRPHDIPGSPPPFWPDRFPCQSRPAPCARSPSAQASTPLSYRPPYISYKGRSSLPRARYKAYQWKGPVRRGRF